MQISAINNLGLNNVKNAQVGAKLQNTNSYADNTVNFTGNDNKKTDASKLRNAAVAMFLVPIASAPLLNGCGGDWVSVNADVSLSLDADVTKDSTSWAWADTVNFTPDTDRPQLLDTLINNYNKWDIDGADTINVKDSSELRNIIHYEGYDEWNYKKEIGDINVKESSKKNLVYDTEILDYKGKHEAYGKTVLRIPDKSFKITTKEGKVLNSPQGFFYEQYECKDDKKGSPIKNCTLKKRAFCQTNGDTLLVAKRTGKNEFVEKGTVSKGFNNTSVLLDSLLGNDGAKYYISDMSIVAVNDRDLQNMYKDAAKNKK